MEFDLSISCPVGVEENVSRAFFNGGNAGVVELLEVHTTYIKTHILLLSSETFLT